MEEKKYLTKEGLEKLKKELDYLKNVRRKEVIRKIEKAVEMGDLSENAEYQEAKEEQAFIEGKILELENILKNATLIEDKQGNNIVKIGHKIVVQRGKTLKTFQIVGSNEADPLEGKISNESPLGKAFLGRKKGEEIEVETPQGKIKYKILEIE